MSLEVDIKTAIQTLIKSALPLVSEPCKVISVNEESSTCDVAPLNGSADVLDVLLNAGGDSSTSITVVPKVDSVVYITYYDKNNAFLSLISELEKVIIVNSSVSLEVSDKVKLNGDDLGGIVKAGELKTQIDKNTDSIEKILDAINTSTTGVSDGGALLQTQMKLKILGAKTADLSNIENDNVSHG